MLKKQQMSEINKLYYDFFTNPEVVQTLNGKQQACALQLDFKTAIGRAIDLAQKFKLTGVVVVEYYLQDDKIKINKSFDLAACQNFQLLV